MKIINIKIISFFVLVTVLYSNISLAQRSIGLTKKQNWQLLDFKQDSVYGTSVNRAYKELLKGKKSHTVIVAVIDEGVDINQEDLLGHIWTNKKEIPSNGKDDDNNGYVDDVHGWNFLGGKDGRNIYATNSEADREYYRLAPQFRGKDTAQFAINKNYRYFLRVKSKHIEDSIARNTDNTKRILPIIAKVSDIDSIIKKQTHKQVVSYQDVIDFQPKDSVENALKKFIVMFYSKSTSVRQAITLDSLLKVGREAIAMIRDDQKLYKQVANDPSVQRKEIIGDNPFNINDKSYGNNLVGDKYANHGTHCAGIIAAIRNNGIGMDGVTDNVLIMPVRAVNYGEYGDERDKDVALAIRYAVDNGARIISMSFGKQLSPQKQWVDDAIKYAGKKGVLLIHAAMNDNLNNDSVEVYPSPNYLNSSGTAKNFITVGATSIDTGLTLPATFSNYGQKQVDIFAPGVAIYSTLPENKYQYYSGTSMATPVVAGIAALILEYYPDLTPEQLKMILLSSVTSLKGKIVYKPGTKQKVDFGTLCKSGGVVNAYKALQLASTISKSNN
jgi:cell wall-associated protease